jgi:hypothetical protein
MPGGFGFPFVFDDWDDSAELVNPDDHPTASDPHSFFRSLSLSTTTLLLFDSLFTADHIVRHNVGE